ncbi:MAG: O-methyltransferase [Halanaerobiales bacterium]
MGDNIFNLWEDKKSVKALEKTAHQSNIPIISRETANIIKSVITVKQPQLILEIGTAIGFSTLWMAEYTGSDSEIVTIEKNQKRFNKARKNIKDFGFGDKITFKFGEAEEIIPYLRRKFDLVFMDAAKGQYLNLFKMVEEKTSEHGVIICDNILYKGLVRSGDQVERNIRTIVVNMRKFLIYLKNNQSFKTEIFDINDGISISTRRKP